MKHNNEKVITIHLRLDTEVKRVFKEVQKLSPVKISTNKYVNTALFEKATRDLEMLKKLSTGSTS